MKTVELILVIAAMCLASGLSIPVLGQTAASNRLSPNALVADLYRAHDRKRSPFFQTRSRALLYKYFEKSLADMIWNDAVKAKGEVGAIGADPLYDAQDMEIKKFVIGKPVYDSGKARVNVSFENFGQKKTLIFILGNGRSGWKINDIDYGESGTLRGWLKEESANAKQDNNFEGIYRDSWYSKPLSSQHAAGDERDARRLRAERIGVLLHRPATLIPSAQIRRCPGLPAECGRRH